MLLTPADAAQARFNVGGRSGPGGAEIEIVARDHNGRVLVPARRGYGPN